MGRTSPFDAKRVDGTIETVTLAGLAAATGQDGRMTEQWPGRPKWRTLTKAYKARILAAFGAPLQGGPERGALLRKELPYRPSYGC